MAYKENLLKKLTIDRLVATISSAIAPADGATRIDMVVLKQLMAHFPWKSRRERDLECYLENETLEKTRILVLDNDLPIYHTTLADVVLRKSPTLKEMINIRNAIKILNDKDVVLSKKGASLTTIQTICIEQLDLRFSAADIEQLAREGVASLEGRYLPGVQESLLLFADLLKLVPAPAAFSLEHHDCYGWLSRSPDGGAVFGPLVIYSRINNTLAWLDEALDSRDKKRLERLRAVAAGEDDAAMVGPAAFDRMHEQVLALGADA